MLRAIACGAGRGRAGKRVWKEASGHSCPSLATGAEKLFLVATSGDAPWSWRLALSLPGCCLASGVCLSGSLCLFV